MLFGGVTYVNLVQVNYGTILEGKTALVTGGSSGIGKAIAQKFLEQGARVIITGRNLEKLENVKQEISNEKLFIMHWDVSNIEIMKEKWESLRQSMHNNPVDILINNAGVYTLENIHTISEQEYMRVMDVNIKGLFFMSQEYINQFMRYKKESKIVEGNIVNISSNRGLVGDISPYGVSKWGVVGLTKGLASEMIIEGVYVNSIAPGMTATEINKINAFENAYEGGVRNKRVVLPEEIAELALFLVSGAGKSITGQVICVDGGTII